MHILSSLELGVLRCSSGHSKSHRTVSEADKSERSNHLAAPSTAKVVEGTWPYGFVEVGNLQEEWWQIFRQQIIR